MKTLCLAALVASFALVAATSLRAAPPGSGPGAVDPAKVELTVTASSAETGIEKGAKNAKPVTLTFVFKNVSKEEIELETTRLDRNLLRLEVTGPDGKTVSALLAVTVSSTLAGSIGGAARSALPVARTAAATSAAEQSVFM